MGSCLAFRFSHRVDGYWDSQGTEIDLVAVDDPGGRIRFATCKRDEERLEASFESTEGHIERFLAQLPGYRSYSIEKVAIAPEITPERSTRIRDRHWRAEDLRSLIVDL